MLEGFTGYLLPWDNTAYWATVVGINLNATAPFAGPFLAQFLQGGLNIGPDTLAKFYALHMLADPRRDLRADRAAPVPRRAPRRHLAAVVERRPPGASAPEATRPARRADPRSPRPRARPSLMGTPLKDRNRAMHKRYKEDVEREGKSFFPYAMLHDSIMSLVVVAVIIGLARRLARDRGRHGGGHPRPVVHGRGRPGHDRVRPAPGLVLLLPLLPPAHLQVAGVGRSSAPSASRRSS